MNEIEESIIRQENEALKQELSRVSLREAEIERRTGELNKSIRSFNDALEESAKTELKKRKWSRNKKAFIVLTYATLFAFGLYLGMAGFVSGKMAKWELKPGENLQATGVCRTRDGGSITLAGDQIRVTSILEESIRGVVVGEKPIYVICPTKEILLESYAVTDLFFKNKIKETPASSIRDIETDPVYLLNKKSILGSGVCLREDNKKVVYSGKVLEVLSIKDIGKEQHKIIAVESSSRKKIECDASELKATILDEESAKQLIAKELSAGAPLEATTLIGRDVLITGTCVLENYQQNNKIKKPLLEFNKTVGTVTSEDRENNSIIRITVTVNDVPMDEEKSKFETATVICDKRMFRNVVIEEYKKPN